MNSLDNTTSARAINLQIVPTISGFSAPVFTSGETAHVYGSGFVEGQTSVIFATGQGTTEVLVNDVLSGNDHATVVIPAGALETVIWLRISNGGSSENYFLTIP